MGTRFLPITKAVPKEILPIIDTPVLGHIVSEAIDSGITDILIITAKGKDAIKTYFSPNPDLSKRLRDNGNAAYADIVDKIANGARISFSTQLNPLGSGDAVLYAKDFTRKEPFCLAWGDDLIYNEKLPVMGQLMAAHKKQPSTILGVQSVNTDDIVKYGVADTKGASIDSNRLAQAYSIVEKPPLSALPSRFAALGRYILQPDIYDLIVKTPLGKNGELQLTDTLNTVAAQGNLYICDFIGKRYDMGDKFGACVATVEYALRDKIFGSRFKEYLKNIK